MFEQAKGWAASVFITQSAHRGNTHWHNSLTYTTDAPAQLCFVRLCCNYAWFVMWQGRDDLPTAVANRFGCNSKGYISQVHISATEQHIWPWNIVSEQFSRQLHCIKAKCWRVTLLHRLWSDWP